jgi:radical SAM/Cys-rich protein
MLVKQGAEHFVCNIIKRHSMNQGAHLKESENSNSEAFPRVEPFITTLSQHALTLKRGEAKTVQINMGFLCNQYCRHCHLNAGPGRKEVMALETVQQVLAYVEGNSFETIDITGGAPELNEHLPLLIEELYPLVPRILVRSNLSALNDGTRDHLFDIFRKKKVVVVASFPSYNKAQTESQRGEGIFQQSLSALKRLNDLGYGLESSGLELNLISNPTGAFLPPDQLKAEARLRQLLKKKFNIRFTNLFNFANVPLGRFRVWLIQTGNLKLYINKLVSGFNPCAVDGLMCRTLVSVSWDGFMYDCDFNLAKGVPMGGQKIHITEMAGPPEPGSHIAVADHCYTCTAGAGFT